MYDALHDFSVWPTMTGSVPADINQFGSHTGNIFLLVCVFIIVSYYRQQSADIMRITCLKQVLIQRILISLEAILEKQAESEGTMGCL